MLMRVKILHSFGWNYNISSEDQSFLIWIWTLGSLSVADIQKFCRLIFYSAMQNSERGKNLNNVINKTSIAMTNTGKAVGEAWTSAKSVVSTWLFGFGGDDDDDLWSYEQEWRNKQKDDLLSNSNCAILTSVFIFARLSLRIPLTRFLPSCCLVRFINHRRWECYLLTICIYVSAENRKWIDAKRSKEACIAHSQPCFPF